MATVSFCLRAIVGGVKQQMQCGPATVRPMGARFKNRPPTRTPTTTPTTTAMPSSCWFVTCYRSKQPKSASNKKYCSGIKSCTLFWITLCIKLSCMWICTDAQNDVYSYGNLSRTHAERRMELTHLQLKHHSVEHTSTRLNSLHLVFHWWAGSASGPEPKSNQLVLVTYPTLPPSFVMPSHIHDLRPPAIFQFYPDLSMVNNHIQTFTKTNQFVLVIHTTCPPSFVPIR